MTEEEIKNLEDAVYYGNDEYSAKFAQELLEKDVEPLDIINLHIKPGLDKIGVDFDNGDAFLPQLMLAGDAARSALDLIIPNISKDDQDQSTKLKVVIGTIYGDAHDIGKNIVIALLAAYGIETIDLGNNVPVSEYVKTAINEDADIIAISSLITTSLPYQREIIKVLRDRGLRDKYFVIVGGGPVTPEWTKEIGADGYGRNAQDAVTLCNNIMEVINENVKPPLENPIILGALKHE